MKRVVQGLCVICVAGMLLSPAWGQDDAKSKRKKARANRPVAAAAAVKLPKSLELTEEQKKQVAALNKEYAPKLSELRKQQNAVLTDEQKAARRDAVAKARAEGKPARAAAAAVVLTDEQKEKQGKIKKELAAIQKEVRGKVMEMLTDEQKKELRESRQGKGQAEGQKKKPQAKKPRAKTKKKSSDTE